MAAETRFSGVVWVDRGGDTQLAKAYGLAHRGYEVANAVDTQFGIASGTKGLTALTVVSLIEEGRLEMTTTARSVLGKDLPLIDDEVSIEHLLAHRSGHRRLLRRGDRSPHHRLRPRHPRPRARHHRTIPSSARGIPE
jgi:CubicO group peptidase (beta-lactamase class C family)